MQDAHPPPPPAQPVQQVHHYYHPQKSGGVAAMLEILPGLFFQTFGIGHLYAGNVGTGLLFMFGYWALAFVNLLLCFVVIGFVTWPLCWVATAIVSTLIAGNSVNNATPSR
ncbi:MAG: hypothetical protein QM761_11675 [Pseudoxanthomonas sp.]